MDFMSNAGLYIAVIGASLAVALACAGSGKGVGIVGEAAAGVISEDPGKFSSCLILQILPALFGKIGVEHPENADAAQEKHRDGGEKDIFEDGVFHAPLPPIL